VGRGTALMARFSPPSPNFSDRGGGDNDGREVDVESLDEAINKGSSGSGSAERYNIGENRGGRRLDLMDEEDYHDVMDAEETGKKEEEGEKIAQVRGAQHSAEEEGAIDTPATTTGRSSTIIRQPRGQYQRSVVWGRYKGKSCKADDESGAVETFRKKLATNTPWPSVGSTGC